MKKVLVLLVLLCVVSFKAEASVFINENYTGNVATKANDTPFLPSEFGTGLAGPVGNQAIVKHAVQFTVTQLSTVNYLAVSANLIPSLNIYDTARSQYISERLAQGATPQQIGLEINGDPSTNTPPVFIGPAQNIVVNFSLIEGSVPWGSDLPKFTPMPSSSVLSTASYNFATDNSLNNKQYNDFFIPWSPVSTQLDPSKDYWIMAEANNSPVLFQYSTKLAGDVTTPEPASLLLMGGGLAGMIWRRRKNSKG